MTFNESIRNAFSNYANFKGRATRSEFWWFYLFYLLISWALYIIGFAVCTVAEVGTSEGGSLMNGLTNGLIVSEILYGVFALIVVCPWLAVSVRRLHDVGTSGWYLLVGLIPIVGTILILIKTLSPTHPVSNDYGPVPQDFIA